MSADRDLATFARRVHTWMLACFGAEIAADVTERNHRFLEEALELVQSKGCTASEAHQLVDYVFGRDVGDVNQEAGGVMVTLAALLNAAGVDLTEAAETELARVWQKVEQIRAKQAAKPKHSPLPTTKFRPAAVDAVHWTGREVVGGTPPWLREAIQRTGTPDNTVGACMRFREEVHIGTPMGVLIAGPGDWLVLMSDGTIWPMSGYECSLNAVTVAAPQRQPSSMIGT